MGVISRATVPGAFLCDILPSWVPFQREAQQGKKMIAKLVDMPFEHVKRQIASGTAEPSLTRELLSTEHTDIAQFEHRVKWATGSMYGAGGETTYATVLNFIMAMALHPESQAKAQQEIDNVIGPERLPTIADLPHLPYVNAVIKESMRWQPVLPLGIARMSGSDDVYNGLLIPKGTIVMPNVWAVAFAEDERYDPKCFIPERFLDPVHRPVDPASWAFGFGRRICPGKALAENSVFILIVSILSSFRITPPKDGLTPKFDLNLISYPKPFQCHITPRSAEHAELVRLRAAQSRV